MKKKMMNNKIMKQLFKTNPLALLCFYGNNGATS